MSSICEGMSFAGRTDLQEFSAFWKEISVQFSVTAFFEGSLSRWAPLGASLLLFWMLALFCYIPADLKHTWKHGECGNWARGTQ